RHRGRAGGDSRAVDRRREMPALGRDADLPSAGALAELFHDGVLDRVGIGLGLRPRCLGKRGDRVALAGGDERGCGGFDLIGGHACLLRLYGLQNAPKYSSAAATPPALCGMPARCSPISTPHSVPHSIRSLKWPRWPMRNTLPLTLPSPVPSDMS